MADKIRVQFDFTPAAFEQLDSLQSRLKARSKAEVIRYALRVLQWLLDQLEGGGQILVKDQGGEVQTVQFTFLDIESTNIQSTKKPAAAVAARAGS